MDTISRDNSSSPLPIAGLIAGALALVLSIVALVKVSTANKTLADHETKMTKVDEVETAMNGVRTSITGIQKAHSELFDSTQKYINLLNGKIEDASTRVTKLEESSKKQPVSATKGGGPVVAGPGEYVVKSGDTSGAKIARDHNVSLNDLMAVNPGVNWSGLKIGQKLKLPQKAAGPAAK